MAPLRFNMLGYIYGPGVGDWTSERGPDGYITWDKEQVSEFEIDTAREAHAEL